MKQVKYTGPYDEVEVPALGLIVKKGKAIVVTNADATALLRQDVWVEEETNSEKEATK